MKVEIFSSPQCHYCEQAKQLLRERGVAFEELDVALDPGHRDELVRRLPQARALPQIFVRGVHIGSFEDLQLLAADGRLERMLAAD